MHRSNQPRSGPFQCILGGIGCQRSGVAGGGAGAAASNRSPFFGDLAEVPERQYGPDRESFGQIPLKYISNCDVRGVENVESTTQ
jgi:hypothetical protein